MNLYHKTIVQLVGMDGFIRDAHYLNERAWIRAFHSVIASVSRGREYRELRHKLLRFVLDERKYYIEHGKL